jgi:DNA repair exonuclease SbcCD ATPase subunit
MSEKKIPEEIKEKLRKRLQEIKEKKMSEGLKENKENLSEKIRERIRKRLQEIREKRKEEDLTEERRRRIRERLLALRERLPRFRKPLSDVDNGICEKRLELLRKRNARLREQLEKKGETLKEAYKVLKKVEELGGIQKIEEAMKLAQDTITKAGTKLFKEAVDMLVAETGADKGTVTELIKKLGLKEAREVLKKKGKDKGAAKTVIVEGLEEKEEKMSPLGVRVAQRLSKTVGVENPKDLKGLSEAIFKK